MLTLDDVNAMAAQDFVLALGGVFEDAPWVAAAAAAARPFGSVGALHEAMMEAVRRAPPAQALAFLQGHPELGGAAARAGAIGADSRSEQAGLGLQRIAQDAAEISSMNAEYQTRFGFPFILCVRRHTRASLMAQFRRRLAAGTAEEREAALAEIGFITRLRLVDKVNGPGAPAVNGWLSTHVLDTARARPAAGVALELFELGEGVRLAAEVTNGDGRTDKPLLAGAPLRMGVYELRFDVGGYYADGSGFLETVPVRFRVSEPEAHYHVPLLVSPGAYSTYRGS